MADHGDVTIVLDRSGSMGSIKHSTIESYNRFLDDRKKENVRISLIQFNHRYEEVYIGVEAKEASPLNDNTFVPDGQTALIDAIGRTIDSIGKRLDSMREEDRPSKVMLAIITDGQENSSEIYNFEEVEEDGIKKMKDIGVKKVAQMIDHQKDKYNWQIVFLGANQDAIATAAKYHINRGSTMSYAANAHGTKRAYEALNQATLDWMEGVSASVDFTKEQREEQIKLGAVPPSDPPGKV